MELIQQETAPVALGVHDILFILFRHKWKIAICALAGCIAAVVVYSLDSRDYESRAKILVRYVLERNAIDSADQQTKPVIQGDTMINTEVEILTSVDLAIKVADAVGVERFVQDEKNVTATSPRASTPASSESSPESSNPGMKAAAIKSILSGLNVQAKSGSNVIAVGYKNHDPDLARTVLDAILKEYWDAHFQVHRSPEVYNFVSKQLDAIRKELAKTEDALSEKMQTVGILSIPEGTATLNARRTRIEEALLLAEAEFAEQQARLKETENLLTTAEATQVKADENKEQVKENAAQITGNKKNVSPAPVNASDAQHYQVLADQVVQLSKSELELLTKFTPENRSVKSVRQRIDKLNLERRALEEKHPGLLTTLPMAVTSNGSRPDIISERANLAAVAGKIDKLKAQLKEAEEQAAALAKAAPDIARLELTKEVQETNLKYMESSLQRAKTDKMLGQDGKTSSDISVVQKPTNGIKVAGQTQKIVLYLAAGGLGLGVGIALLIELLLNRSIRRPLELETRLRIPQMLSIPHFADQFRDTLLLQDHNSNESGKPVRLEIAPWDTAHYIRSFTEEIRDRLILSFKLKQLTHKPKLIGIAGLSGGEGASTIAGSLAAALSETGDGRVLLVDLNASHSKAHPFFDGNPVCGLVEALNANGSLPPFAGNLYLASGVSQNGRSMHLATKQFYALIPNLRTSQFDYIVFDMPPVNQGGATLAIAGCLDKLLFVVEAEKSDRDVVKRAYGELVAAKAGGIL